MLRDKTHKRSPFTCKIGLKSKALIPYCFVSYTVLRCKTKVHTLKNDKIKRPNYGTF